ncbi:hypothetical protein ACFE04_016412 [Oxalis oulophora]
MAVVCEASTGVGGVVVDSAVRWQCLGAAAMSRERLVSWWYGMYVLGRRATRADADGNGTIDYDKFITATMHMNIMDREEHLYTAFQHFDKDNIGYITTNELEQALRDFGMHDGRDIKEIISEVDVDHVVTSTTTNFAP